MKTLNIHTATITFFMIHTKFFNLIYHLNITAKVNLLTVISQLHQLKVLNHPMSIILFSDSIILFRSSICMRCMFVYQINRNIILQYYAFKHILMNYIKYLLLR